MVIKGEMVGIQIKASLFNNISIPLSNSPWMVLCGGRSVIPRVLRMLNWSKVFQ